MNSRNLYLAIAVVLIIAACASSGAMFYFKKAADASESRAKDLAEENSELKTQLEDVNGLLANSANSSLNRIIAAPVERKQPTEPEPAAKPAVAVAEKPQPAEAPSTNQAPRNPWLNTTPQDGKSWMDSLKENDPKRYEEIMARREEARKKVEQTFATKANYLLNRDISKMTADELADYQLMTSTLDQTWRMAEKLSTGTVSHDERHQIMSNISSNIQVLTPLFSYQRDLEFYNVGRKLGYSETDAAGFVDYMNGMIEATSTRTILDSMHGGRRGGPFGSRSRGTAQQTQTPAAPAVPQ